MPLCKIMLGMAMPGTLSQETRKGSLKSEWSGEGRGIKQEGGKRDQLHHFQTLFPVPTQLASLAAFSRTLYPSKEPVHRLS